MLVEANSVHFQMCSDGVETFLSGTSLVHGVPAVGPDPGGRLKSGFEFSRKSQTCPLLPSRNPSWQGIQLHHIRGLSGAAERSFPVHHDLQRWRNLTLPRRHLVRNIDILSTTLTALLRQPLHQRVTPEGYDDILSTDSLASLVTGNVWSVRHGSLVVSL